MLVPKIWYKRTWAGRGGGKKRDQFPLHLPNQMQTMCFFLSPELCVFLSSGLSNRNMEERFTEYMNIKNGESTGVFIL